jgi:hypothetical protein
MKAVETRYQTGRRQKRMTASKPPAQAPRISQRPAVVWPRDLATVTLSSELVLVGLIEFIVDIT